MNISPPAHSGSTLAASEALWIDQDTALDDCLRHWRDQPVIGIDTEFVRTDTFYAKLGLLQASDGGTPVLIDPLAVDPTPVFELVADPGKIKVLHSGSEDIGIFLHQSAAPPAALFDTQIAAALLGMGPSLSYPALANELIGIELDKGEQRSDWTRRPLSEAQKHYAANDVVHLLQIYDQLRERLEQRERLEWVFEDTALLVKSVQQQTDPAVQFSRFKLAWKLNSLGRMVLWNLLSWREQQARHLDRPRSRVLHDDALVHLSFNRPADQQALATTPRLSPGLRRKVGDELLTLIEQAASEPETNHPPAPPRPLGLESKNQMKVLKSIITSVSQELDIAPETLCSRRDLVAMIHQQQLPARLQGWRREVIGNRLLEQIG